MYGGFKDFPWDRKELVHVRYKEMDLLPFARSSPTSLARRSCSLACSASRVFSERVVTFAASRLYRAASRSWKSRTSDLRIDQHPPKAIRLRRTKMAGAKIPAHSRSGQVSV